MASNRNSCSLLGETEAYDDAIRTEVGEVARITDCGSDSDDSSGCCSSSSSSTDNETTIKKELQRAGRWLLYLSSSSSSPSMKNTVENDSVDDGNGADLGSLQHTPEFRNFMTALKRLNRVHCHHEQKQKDCSKRKNKDKESKTRSETIATEMTEAAVQREPGAKGNSDPPCGDNIIKSSLAPPIIVLDPSQPSFLAEQSSDDLVLRIFDFLTSVDLVNCTRLFNKRFRRLAVWSARARTSKWASQRQLTSVLQLLRAKEQNYGCGEFDPPPHVRIPMLLPRRRVSVSGTGDDEYNGLYYCTGCNGNGFVFTKRQQRADPSEEPNGPMVRCIIAKRFSNETILWYMSKEEEAEGRDYSGDYEIYGNSVVRQTFSFWAKLMVIGDASPEICCYPSQTSILTTPIRNGNGEANPHHHQGGWQPLVSTQSVHPPTVELLD